MVRAITGFHGGGGTHRLKPDIELTPLLAEIAAGTLKPDPDDMPVDQVQHLCGALAAGIMCVSLLFGRVSPDDDLTCVDELSYELHRRFKEELGTTSAVSSATSGCPLAMTSPAPRSIKRGPRLLWRLFWTPTGWCPSAPR